MTEDLFVLPASGAYPGMGVSRMHRAEGIQITVRLLCGRDNSYQGIQLAFELLVRPFLQAVGGAFDDLIKICVVERKFRRRVSGELFRGPQEIVDPACFF